MTTSVVCVIIMYNHNKHMGFDVQWHERKDNTRNINVIYTYILSFSSYHCTSYKHICMRILTKPIYSLQLYIIYC